jgi:hypothetical protein
MKLGEFSTLVAQSMNATDGLRSQLNVQLLVVQHGFRTGRNSVSRPGTE